MRAILEATVRPTDRLRLGTAIRNLSCTHGLTKYDIDTLEHVPSTAPAQPPLPFMILLDTNVVSTAMKPRPFG